MTAVSAYLYCACVVIAFTEMAAWTLDLEEVRKFFDDQKRKEELEQDWSEHADRYGDYGGLYEGHGGHYAAGYQYGSYMEKKVHGIVKNGTRYLEGLRLSIENFKLMVENCTRANTTRFPGLRWNGTAPRVFNASWVQGLDSNHDWPQILNISAAMLGLNTSNPSAPLEAGIGEQLDRGRCANATREREKVRRLADLALWTTRRLDRTMRGSYEDSDDEEIELLVRLAWFLEQLAHVTGFDPEASEFVSEGAASQKEAEPTRPPLGLPIPDDVKLQMINCLQQNSSVPATERCAIPVQLPPLLRLVLNIPEDNVTAPVSSSTETTSVLNRRLPTNLSTSPLETLETVESRQMSKSASFSRAVRSVRKRSTDDPTLGVVKYYVKHKLWEGSNAVAGDSVAKGDFSIDNNISVGTSIQKRSASEKVSFGPLDTFIKKFIDKINLRVESNLRNKRIDKKSMVAEKSKSLQKRSIKYENSLVVRQSEDPMQDISYYVKNKPGTNVRPSLVGAAEARLALERIFQTGNIEVVRRYGANYNPLIPSPFYFGVIKTISDI